MTVQYRFPHHQVTIHRLGKEYTGYYAIDTKTDLINVSYGGLNVTTQISGQPEEVLARVLLGELIDKKK